MRDMIGRRVLVSIGSNDAVRRTCIEAVSPNGLYVKLGGDRPDEEAIGWVVLAGVTVLDTLPERKSIEVVKKDVDACGRGFFGQEVPMYPPVNGAALWRERHKP